MREDAYIRSRCRPTHRVAKTPAPGDPPPPTRRHPHPRWMESSSASEVPLRTMSIVDLALASSVENPFLFFSCSFWTSGARPLEGQLGTCRLHSVITNIANPVLCILELRPSHASDRQRRRNRVTEKVTSVEEYSIYGKHQRGPHSKRSVLPKAWYRCRRVKV